MFDLISDWTPKMGVFAQSDSCHAGHDGRRVKTPNFHRFVHRIPEGKRMWKPTRCSSSNLQRKIQSLEQIPSKIQPNYQLVTLVVNALKCEQLLSSNMSTCPQS